MSTATALQPLNVVVVGPGENRAPMAIQLPGHSLEAKLLASDTGGAYTIGVLKAEPLSGPPLHIHTREDEWFYVLKGEFTFQVGGQRFTGGAGTSVFAPRNIPHTWQNLTNETAEAIAMVTPCGFENALAEVASRPMNQEEITALFDRYGVIMVGPPIR